MVTNRRFSCCYICFGVLILFTPNTTSANSSHPSQSACVYVTVTVRSYWLSAATAVIPLPLPPRTSPALCSGSSATLPPLMTSTGDRSCHWCCGGVVVTLWRRRSCNRRSMCYGQHGPATCKDDRPCVVVRGMRCTQPGFRYVVDQGLMFDFYYPCRSDRGCRYI